MIRAYLTGERLTDGVHPTRCGVRNAEAIKPTVAAKETHIPGTARFPVACIRNVQIAGVKPPNAAVAQLYANENPVVRTSIGMISVRNTTIAPV